MSDDPCHICDGSGQVNDSNGDPVGCVTCDESGYSDPDRIADYGQHRAEVESWPTF